MDAAILESLDPLRLLFGRSIELANEFRNIIYNRRLYLVLLQDG